MQICIPANYMSWDNDKYAQPPFWHIFAILSYKGNIFVISKMGIATQYGLDWNISYDNQIYFKLLCEILFAPSIIIRI